MAGKKTGKRLLTWVLVLVMALSLLPLNALAEENDVPENTNPSIVESEENRGAHLVKSATKNTDDTYKIQLESWVTGKVEQTTGSAPLDIVLVLDQSGSMEGKKLSKLKEAVRNFVATINQNVKDNNVEHRICLLYTSKGILCQSGYCAGEDTTQRPFQETGWKLCRDVSKAERGRRDLHPWTERGRLSLRRAGL